VAPAALSILAVTFAEGAERNRALGIYGALSGVTHSMTGLASGLVETMREIGGAIGVAAGSGSPETEPESARGIGRKLWPTRKIRYPIGYLFLHLGRMFRVNFR
jgi:hypothetical protein